MSQATILTIIYTGTVILAGFEVLPPVNDKRIAWFAGPAVLLGIPFSAWLPHVRFALRPDAILGSEYAYFLPRWIVCVFGSHLSAMAVTAATLTLFHDARNALSLLVFSAAAVVFITSAYKRFARNPEHERVIHFLTADQTTERM